MKQYNYVFAMFVILLLISPATAAENENIFDSIKNFLKNIFGRIETTGDAVSLIDPFQGRDTNEGNSQDPGDEFDPVEIPNEYEPNPNSQNLLKPTEKPNSQNLLKPTEKPNPSGGSCSITSNCFTGLWCDNGFCCRQGFNCCSSNINCLKGTFCGADFTCHQEIEPEPNPIPFGGACTSSPQCAPGLECNNNICTLTGFNYCTTDTDCTLNKFCATDNLCYDKSDISTICTSDTECQSGKCGTAIGEGGIDVSFCCEGTSCCLADSQCPDSQICNPNTYSCTRTINPPPSTISSGEICSFTSSSSCQSGLHCYNNVCCEDGSYCCSQDSDCPQDAFCGSDNTCYYKAEVGTICDQGADNQCSSGNCGAATNLNGNEIIFCCEGTPEENCCLAHEQCSGEYDICHPDQYSCTNVCEYYGNCCTTNSDCSAGKICQPWGCALPQTTYTLPEIKKLDGQSCSASSQCLGGECQELGEEGICCTEGKTCCNTRLDCPTSISYTCQNHYCIETLPEKEQRCGKECLDFWMGDGECDSSCNIAACKFDGGDCKGISRTPQGQICENDYACSSRNCENNVCCLEGETCCTIDSECSGNQICENSYCQESDVTTRCDPDCPDRWLNDGFCDQECNRPECNYDNYDCTKKPGEVYTSPGEEGIRICDFPREYENYGSCFFESIGEIKEINKIGKNKMISYCEISTKLTDAISGESKENLAESSGELISTFLKITDTNEALARTLDTLECFDNSRRLSGEKLDYTIKSIVETLYSKENTQSVSVIAHSPSDILVEYNEETAGINKERNLQTSLNTAIYKHLKNSNTKIIIVQDIDPEQATFYAYGTDTGETDLTIIEINKKGKEEYREFKKIPTSSGSVLVKNGRYISLDADGDSIFEESEIAPDTLKIDSLNRFLINAPGTAWKTALILFLAIFFVYYLVKRKK